VANSSLKPHDLRQFIRRAAFVGQSGQHFALLITVMRTTQNVQLLTAPGSIKSGLTLLRQLAFFKRHGEMPPPPLHACHIEHLIFAGLGHCRK
jgi:hypothetical protein